ncbi:MAG: hypothetical protein FJX34_03685 [Alphaproteobacteria bacterium]|nr:hypothetical protein [Alphaproteobacteria bacterium]
MLHIFNLFLVLFAFWGALMFAFNQVSWLYLFFGILFSALVSMASARLKLIEKNSEFLYLYFGFYRHFFKIFVGDFFSSIALLISLACRKSPFHPVKHKVKLQQNQRSHPALLIASINMITGLSCLSLKDDEIVIYAVDQRYFDRLNLKKICADLRRINDDHLL